MEEAKAVAETLAGNSEGLKYIGAALAIGLGALGTGLGMGLTIKPAIRCQSSAS